MAKVIVVGGGLAGMVAARALARKGFAVSLYEAEERLGGKAGADDHGGGPLREHGYHIFPAWYRNVRGILEELSIPLTDFDRWHYIHPGGLAHPITIQVPDSLSSLYRAVFKGLLPWPDTVLYWYFVLDMLGQPLSRKAILDQVSRVGLMRGRWYMTSKIPELESVNVLTASAVPVFNLSAMTAKKISAYWVRTPLPFLSILEGDLQRHFIDPLAASVRAAGVEVHLQEAVTELRVQGEKLAGVRTRTADGKRHRRDADEVVVTTPLEVSRKLMNAELQALEPALGKFEHLQANPMASLHLRLRHILPHVPRQHVFLLGSRYGLSFIDLRENWGLPTTTLSCIASNFSMLQALPYPAQEAALLGELERYLGIAAADVEEVVLLPNVEDPLFISTVGAWQSRPGVQARKVKNLFFAGDWVRNPIDLACMEGAVSAAMSAARALAEKYGEALPAPERPPTYPPALLRGLAWALAPAMVPVWLAAKVLG